MSDRMGTGLDRLYNTEVKWRKGGRKSVERSRVLALSSSLPGHAYPTLCSEKGPVTPGSDHLTMKNRIGNST